MEDAPAISFVLCHAVDAQILENLAQPAVDASGERLQAGTANLARMMLRCEFTGWRKGRIRPIDRFPGQNLSRYIPKTVRGK